MVQIVWCSLLIIFIIAEIATPQLTTVWFALGALVSLIVSAFTDIIWVQIVVFVLVSIISILLTRKWARKFLNNKKQPTNTDRYLQTEALVTEEINNLLGKGQVNVKGIIWSAKNIDEEVTIPEGAHVIIERIEGVKMIVSFKNN